MLIVPVCPLFTAPDNGNIDCSLGGDGDANPGDTCTFSCDGGYELQGSSVRTCLNSERWSGTSAVCEQGRAINKINKGPFGSTWGAWR